MGEPHRGSLALNPASQAPKGLKSGTLKSKLQNPERIADWRPILTIGQGLPT